MLRTPANALTFVALGLTAWAGLLAVVVGGWWVVRAVLAVTLGVRPI